jgi:hypothetical protein
MSGALLVGKTKVVSSGVLLVRVNQSPIREVLQRVKIAATL